MKKQKFLKWNFEVLASSLKKINLNVFLIIILDIVFYSSSLILLALWWQRVQEKISAFSLPQMGVIIAQGAEKVNQLANDEKMLYILIFFSFILIILAIIFLASILKGIIWAKTTNTKISLRLISKFLALNLIWISFWLIILFLIYWLFEPKSVAYSIIAALILGIFLTNTLYAIFMREQKIKCIFRAARISIAKIHLFALPYAFIALVLFTITSLAGIFKFKYMGILAGLAVIASIAIARYYISTLVLEIEKTK